jgi:hypothetical protein
LDQDALTEIAAKSEFMKNEMNKKFNKNVMNWRGQNPPTVQQKPTNFSMAESKE